VSRILVRACSHLLANTPLILSLQREGYAIGFAEQYDECGWALMRLVGVRRTHWLSATAMWRLQAEEFGSELPLSYVPELFSTFTHRMDFVEWTAGVPAVGRPGGTRLFGL